MTELAIADRPGVLRIRTAGDLAALIPYLIGFHPDDSLVLVGFGCAAGTLGARVDLPPPGSAGRVRDVAAHVADLLVRDDADCAALVGYGPGARVTPALEAARAVFAERRVRVVDALRVHDGRYWSYVCDDPRCCPPEGTAYDATASEVAATATLAGCVALASRAELERSIAPVTGPERAAMRRATAAAERRFVARMPRCDRDAGRAEALTVAEDIAFTRAVIERARGGDAAALSEQDVAWLGLLLTRIPVRDEAWMGVDDAHLDAHIALWRAVVRRVQPPYVPAPACLLAVAAWLAGQGALANIAVDRALAADGAYSMAVLLRDAMMGGLPVDAMRAVMRAKRGR